MHAILTHTLVRYVRMHAILTHTRTHLPAMSAARHTDTHYAGHSFLSRTRVDTLATRTACLILVFQLQDFRQFVKEGDKVLSTFPGKGTLNQLFPATVSTVYKDLGKVMLTWDDDASMHRYRFISDMYPPKVGSSNCVCSV